MCWVTLDMLTGPRLEEYLRLKPPSEIYSFVLRGCRNSGKSSKYIVKVILNLQILAKWNVMCPCEDVNTSPKVGQKSWQPSLVFITRSPESWGQPQQLAGGGNCFLNVCKYVQQLQKMSTHLFILSTFLYVLFGVHYWKWNIKYSSYHQQAVTCNFHLF